jgi:hypothetical protein
MPGVEVTDSVRHRNDGRHRPAIEEEKEKASLFSISRRFNQRKSGGTGGYSIKYKIARQYHNYGNTSISSTTSIMELSARVCYGADMASTHD